MRKESLCAEGFEEGWLGAIYGKYGKRGVVIDLTKITEEDNFFTEARIPAALGL